MFYTQLSALIPLLITVFLGSYFQSWIGFGLGLFVMGIIGGFDLITIPILATTVNFLALSNNLLALRKNWHAIEYKIMLYCLIPLLPMIPIGVITLSYLNDNALHILRLTLGLLIILSGISLLLNPKPKNKISHPIYFGIFGALAGFLGGLFSLGTLPLVYFLFRQPITLNKTRTLLLVLIACLTVIRISCVAILGTLNLEIINYVLISLPVVWIGNLLAKRKPIKLSELSIRRTAFTLFTLLGLLLVNNA